MSKMSEDEVFERNLEGLPENYRLNPAKRREHKVIKPADATVQISLKIEGDLLDRLKKTARAKGLGYQTLLKQLVRAGLEPEEKQQVTEPFQAQIEANMHIAVQALVQAAVLAAKNENNRIAQ